MCPALVAKTLTRLGGIKIYFDVKPTENTQKPKDFLPCLNVYALENRHHYFNTLRTGSFKLFKRPFPGFLTILTI